MTRRLYTNHNIPPVSEQINTMKQNPEFAKGFEEISDIVKKLKEKQSLSPSSQDIIKNKFYTTQPAPSTKILDKEKDNRNHSIYG